jgi:hypothetical protein
VKSVAKEGCGMEEFERAEPSEARRVMKLRVAARVRGGEGRFLLILETT